MDTREKFRTHRTAIRITEQMQFMKNYACSLTGAADTADDLVQECAIRALKNVDKYEPGTNMKAWLATIMRNLYIDEKRSVQRRPGTVPVEDWRPEMSVPANQNHRLELRDARRRFKRLRPSEASAFRLVVADGHSYESAADILSIAEGTVKSRLSRAREKLRAA